MHRTHLFYADGVYFAGTYSDADKSLIDVTGDKDHERRAVLYCGEWTGKGILPRDLCAKASEHGEQAALFAWAAACHNVGIVGADRLMQMYAIPNGGKRDPKTAAMLKAEGVRTGVPDVCLPVAVFADAGGPHYQYFSESFPFAGVFCGLYIEMKKVKGGVLSPEQKERMDGLRNGYAVARANGWQQARDLVIAYLGLME